MPPVPAPAAPAPATMPSAALGAAPGPAAPPMFDAPAPAGAAPAAAPAAPMPGQMPDPGQMAPDPALEPGATPLATGLGKPGAPDRQALERLVAEWWKRTDSTPEFSAAVAAHAADLVVLEGNPNDAADPTTVTAKLIYRYQQQLVAMVLPDQSTVAVTVPTPIPDPTGAGPVGPIGNDMRFALTATMLVRQYLTEDNFFQTAQEWIEDAAQFRLGIVKAYWQDAPNAHAEPVITARLADHRDNAEALAYLSAPDEPLDEDGAEQAEIEQQMLALVGTDHDEETVRRGFVVETVMLPRFRFDPACRSAAKFYQQAGWCSFDSFLTRRDVLQRFPDLTVDDLRGASCYDATGQRQREAERQRQTPGQSTTSDLVGAPGVGGMLANPDNAAPTGVLAHTRVTADEDILLVREVWDRRSKTVITLVDGCPVPVARWKPRKPTRYWFPVSFIVFNPRASNVYGFSFTELQAKIQHAINKKLTRKDEAQAASAPRFGYLPSLVTDPAAFSNSIDTAKPYAFFPVHGIESSVDDIRKVIAPIESSHSFNPAEYDISHLEVLMRTMSGQPQVLSGGVGGTGADFSSEVQGAMQAQSVGMRHLQGRATHAFAIVVTMLLDHLVWNLTAEEVTERCGANAYWPASLPERLAYLRKCKADVAVNLDAQLDRAQQERALLKFLEVATASGIALEAEPLLRQLGRIIGTNTELDAMVRPDPAALVSRLVRAIQLRGMEALSQEAVAAIIALAQALMPMAQEVAPPAEPGAPGEAPSEGGDAPPPADSTASAAPAA